MPATKMKAVLITAFEPDAGPVPGELRYFRERFPLPERLEFAAGYRPLWTHGRVLAVTTGVGTARAAASIMALGMDARFDLSEAYWMVAGVAGADPARAVLGSVVMPEFVVDGDLMHEIDGREIPAGWVDGFVPMGKTTPYEEPHAHRFDGDDGIVFRLNRGLMEWAIAETRGVELYDTEAVSARRAQFAQIGGPAAHPVVQLGDELASATFFHGKLMGERAARWVAYQTHGAGTYTVTGMEDTGILQSLTFLAKAGRVDFSRVLVLRGVSNYDRQRPGLTAAESLVESKVTTYSAYLPVLENLWRVGSRILRAFD